MKLAAQTEFLHRLAMAGKRRERLGFRERVLDVCESEEWQVERMQRQRRDERFALSRDIRATPEPSTRIGIDAVIDLTPCHCQRRLIGTHSQLRRMIGGLQQESRVGRPR